jgi:RNA polymerase sigma-70 factor (ECF subfamily)
MRAHQNLVFSSAVRITGNAAQAEDIAQEVFIKAYEHFDNLRSSETAGGWLRTVARNLSLNYATRHRRRWRLFSEMATGEEDEGGDFQDGLPSPEVTADGTLGAQRSVLIEEALRSLPEHQRLPLVLYHFEEMPYEEIAAQLKISLAKVKVDIHRGRAALAKALERIGVTADEVAQA